MKYCLLLVAITGCASKLKVEPVKVEPIHMTIDVNLHDGNKDLPTRQP